MYRIICLVLVALSILFSSTVSAEQTLDQLEAQEVVNRYFDALKQGDTKTVKNLIDGDFLTSQKSLLNNSAYPDHLINIYKDMSFEITGIESFKDGLIAVNTKVLMNKEDLREKRFMLHRAERENTTSNQLYIFAEIDASLTY